MDIEAIIKLSRENTILHRALEDIYVILYDDIDKLAITDEFPIINEIVAKIVELKRATKNSKD